MVMYGLLSIDQDGDRCNCENRAAASKAGGGWLWVRKSTVQILQSDLQGLFDLVKVAQAMGEG